VTWTDGWPYFGLPGNLGRTPRTWIKPKTEVAEKPRAPYQRSDDFSGRTLGTVWQWNHVPVDEKWSLAERPGFLRLHALRAPDLWRAKNTLTQRAMGPRSTVTAVMDTKGMKPGDVAGLALFNRPYAWLGVERGAGGFELVWLDEVTGKTARAAVKEGRVWLRAECDFIRDSAVFRYSVDGKKYVEIGEPHTMAYGLITFQGVRYSLFSYNTREDGESGFADFDSLEVREERARPIPYGKRLEFTVRGAEGVFRVGKDEVFRVVDRGLGRVALQGGSGFVSVDKDGLVSMKPGGASAAETFQWIETFEGELTLMSLVTNRFVRVDRAEGRIVADSPGPRPDGLDGVRLSWRVR
jgi:xylan 1,4-beta-xylosidase